MVKTAKMKEKVTEGERVRKSSPSGQNIKIDAETLMKLKEMEKSPARIGNRISELNKEWDMERTLETNMSILALTGIVLAIFVHIYWIILPSIVLLFFLQHALQGWCPPIPVFRALGVRTRPEIDREKYALKVLRGDFTGLPDPGNPLNVEKIFNAVRKD